MATLAPHARRHRVSIVGSGNWGSTIAKIVAENVLANPQQFEKEVRMWVFEEEIKLPEKSKHYSASSELSTKPQKLTSLINHFHENVKYLPDVPLPHNIVATPSLRDSVAGSTILVFNLPHQFIGNVCSQLRGHIVPFARGISCIKGVDVRGDSVALFSERIGAELGIYCGALSGANIANEVAQEKFSETTIAYDPPPMDSQTPTPAGSGPPSPAGSHVDLTQLAHKDASGKVSKVKLRPVPSDYPPIDHETIKKLFHRPYFHVRVVDDVAGTSLGGALKNIVAVAAGFVDGLGWGDNAKAAIMRIGLLEMVQFGKRFFEHTVHTATFTEESAGVADLITTCSGGRNHRCAKLSVQRGVPIEEVEASELNGQKLQGTLTAKEVNTFLKARGMEKDFPLFTATYDVLQGKAKPQDLPSLIQSSSEELPNYVFEEDKLNRREEPYPNQPTSSPNSTHRPDELPTRTSFSTPVNHKQETPKRAEEYSHQPQERFPDSRRQDTFGRRLQPKNSLPFASGQASFFNGNDGIKNPSNSMTQTSRRLNTRGKGSILTVAHPLTSSRYTRHLPLQQIGVYGQTTLLQSRVLVIGLGGLGSPAALYLAAAGVGTVGLVDDDFVELSNLQRQIAHNEAKAGWSKASSAADAIRALNSDIKVIEFRDRFESHRVERIMGSSWDLVLDCSDNPATRYLISDACVAWGVPLISGAAQKLDGQLMILCWNGKKAGKGEWPCYRCVFPNPPKPEMVQGCDEIGILGTTVGTIGVMMAGEAIKVLVSRPQVDDDSYGTNHDTSKPSNDIGGMMAGFKPTMLLFSAFGQPMLRTVGLRRRRKDCLACSGQIDKGALESGRIDYVAFCGLQEDPNLLHDDERITASEFTQKILAANQGPVVIDVREKPEFDMGPTVNGSINIPISKILRQDLSYSALLGDDNQAPEKDRFDEANPIYVVCQRGNDSQFAVQKIKEQRAGGSNKKIIDVRGGIEDLARLEAEEP